MSFKTRTRENQKEKKKKQNYLLEGGSPVV